jgi:hypothetical protein
MKTIYLVFALCFFAPSLSAQESDKIIPWNQFSKRLPGRKMFMFKAVGQKIGGVMKIFPINKKTTNQLYREALNIVQNKLKLKLTRPPKLVISDFITGISKQKTLDELIEKSGITTKSEASQFKYGQEAQIVPAAYLPSNTIVVYRDNISIFYKLLSFKKKELREAVKLALIHELIHAYQSQEIVGVDRMVDQNEKNLYILEGHATYITNVIAQETGMVYTNRVGLSFFTNLGEIGEKYQLGLDEDVLEHVNEGHIQGSAFFKKLRRKTRGSLGMWNQIKRIFYKKMVPPNRTIDYHRLFYKF